MVSPDEIYKEVLLIKNDVLAVKHQTSWMLRSHAESVAPHWREIFGLKQSTKRNFSKMRVYLATNGKRTINEIASDAEVHRSDAGKWLTDMERENIVELLPSSKGSKLYRKTPADFALGISGKLEEELAKKGCQPEQEK
jgi:hypothetical protein